MNGGEAWRSGSAQLSTTVDPALLDAVDRFVAEDPAAHRSQVIDEALRLWVARAEAGGICRLAAAAAGGGEGDPDGLTPGQDARNCSTDDEILLAVHSTLMP
ncbi:MAG: ribbon-helix-helix domain-containing protein [Chloroflexota bacterium]|nr:ribbon-helix-helix domain-containing protein [Chloroflexota bacterium]